MGDDGQGDAAAAENALLLRSFERELKNRNRSARTMQSYRECAELLGAFCPGRTFPEMTRREVGDFIGDQLDRHKPTTAAVRFRGLRAFFNFLVAEEIIETSPMARMMEPHVPEQPVPVFTDAELTALLKITEGREFDQRRDHAIIRVLLDCGIRVGELAGLMLDDVDLGTYDQIFVMGKGSRGRVVPFGTKTGTALDRYLRERRKHQHAKLPNLWVGNRSKGAMTASGIAQMLYRRGEQAGVADVHPHRFRHTFAHSWKASGGGEEDLMRLVGWSSRAMLAKYGASEADVRARASHRRMSLGDRV